MTTSDEQPDVEPVWLITANVLQERAYGEGGGETRIGTKHFRGNAKVFIVDAYWGMCENVTVIGHHRASGRFVKMDLPLHYLDNLRMSLCYSPKVIGMAYEHWSRLKGIPGKEDWEQKLAVLRSWPG